MDSLTIRFKNTNDKTTIQKIIEVLNMDVELIDQESVIPEEHYQTLDNELKQYQNGDIKSNPWEEVEKKARKKIGL